MLPSAPVLGTEDLKRNAVTSAKVKNGTLKHADLVRDRRFRYIGGAGAPDFSTGGQGDCVWQPGSAAFPGFSKVGFRKDRFGTVHLVGVAVPVDGVGGDASCDSVSEVEDAIVFILPAAYRPARTTIRSSGTDGAMIIVGNTPLTGLPAGAVVVGGPAGSAAGLDGISYQPVGSTLVSGRSTERLTPEGRRVLRQIGIG
jgi:hypothetical protein